MLNHSNTTNNFPFIFYLQNLSTPDQNTPHTTKHNIAA